MAFVYILMDRLSMDVLRTLYSGEEIIYRVKILQRRFIVRHYYLTPKQSYHEALTSM